LTGQAAGEDVRLRHLVALQTAKVDQPPPELPYVGLEHVESWTGRTGAVDPKEAYIGGAVVLFEPGDVLFGKLRPYLAKGFLANFRGSASTEFLVLRPGSRVLGRWLLHRLLIPEFIARVSAATYGAKMPRAGWEDVRDLTIGTPSVEWQALAVDLIDRECARIDAMLAEQERVIAGLEEERIAAIEKLVAQPAPGAAPTMPPGSLTARLKHVVPTIEQGWSPQCENRMAGEEEWGVLKAGAVNGGALRVAEQKALPAGLDPLTEYEVRPGDVLMSRANTRELLGAVAYIEQCRPRLLLCDKLYRLGYDSTKVDPRFLAHVLRSRSARLQLEAEATGASNSMQNIGQDTVRNLRLALPPLVEQHRLVELIAGRDDIVNAAGAQARHVGALLREYRTAFISSAVTGRLNLAQVAA
jgi:type I restriction enzyme S subunit